MSPHILCIFEFLLLLWIQSSYFIAYSEIVMICDMMTYYKIITFFIAYSLCYFISCALIIGWSVCYYHTIRKC